MRLRFPTLLSILYLPTLSLSHPHPLHPRELACNPTPSPNLHHADCRRALTDILDPLPPNDLYLLTHPPATGGAPTRLPHSFVAGSCRVTVGFVNGVTAVGVPWAEIVGRALNLVDYCVEAVGAEVPRGGTSRFGLWRVVVEEVVMGTGPRVVGPGTGAGAGAGAGAA